MKNMFGSKLSERSKFMRGYKSIHSKRAVREFLTVEQDLSNLM